MTHMVPGAGDQRVVRQETHVIAASPRGSSVPGSAAPAERGRPVRLPEDPNEVARIAETDPVGDLFDGKVGLDEETAGLHHSSLEYPALDGPAGLASHDGREMAGGQRDGGRDRPQ